MMKKNELLYLSQADVAAAGPSMSEIIEALETAFKEKGHGRAEMPPKPGVHPGGGDNFIHAMPAYIPALKSAGIKWVGGFPDNTKHGLPYITGLLILNDTTTGLPLAVMDCIWITAMRTGAASAVSARYLARPESAVVGVLGCGLQGRTNVEALNVLFLLKRVMAYDVQPEALERYADEIQSRFDLEVVAAQNPRDAVTGCKAACDDSGRMDGPRGLCLAGGF
jgi:ornithine cyclodeaminase/alanine dehydrogenase